MKAWISHFAMNMGSAIANLFFAIVPPQLTGHTDEDLRKLRETGPLTAFLFGLSEKNGASDTATRGEDS